jgi:hypothetical protein
MWWPFRAAAQAFVPPHPVKFMGLPSPIEGYVGPAPIDEMIGAMLAASGGAGRRVTRLQALSVAEVMRGRNEICSISTLPLRLYRGLDVVESPLLRQIDPDVPNVVTLAATVEDLLFEAVAWWRVLARDFDGFPVAARRVAPSDVSPGDSPSVLMVAGVRVPASDMIKFTSPNPALLVEGARPIRRAILLGQLAETFAENPRPND